jgi:hypothetical protein
VRARGTRRSTTRRRAREAKRKTRAGSTSAKVNIAGSDCTAGISSIHALIDRSASEVIAKCLHRPEGRCVDSESQILAIKKFSCLTASRLILARQRGFFCESPTPIRNKVKAINCRPQRAIGAHDRRSARTRIRGDAAAVLP